MSSADMDMYCKVSIIGMSSEESGLLGITSAFTVDWETFALQSFI